MTAPQPLVTLSIEPPSEDPKSRADLALQAAKSRVIATDAEYVASAAELKAVKAKWNALDAQRKDLVKPIDEAREKVQLLFRDPLNWLEQAETIIKNKMVDYSNEKERERREAQARADEEARKERERLQREADEVERKAREKAESDRRAAAAAREAGDREKADKLDRRAGAAESKATAKAEQLASAAASVVAPVIQRDTPKVPGVSKRSKWTYEITNEALIPREYLVVNETALRKVVEALKGQAKIPGIRVFEGSTLAAGDK